MSKRYAIYLSLCLICAASYASDPYESFEKDSAMGKSMSSLESYCPIAKHLTIREVINSSEVCKLWSSFADAQWLELAKRIPGYNWLKTIHGEVVSPKELLLSLRAPCIKICGMEEGCNLGDNLMKKELCLKPQFARLGSYVLPREEAERFRSEDHHKESHVLTLTTGEEYNLATPFQNEKCRIICSNSTGTLILGVRYLQAMPINMVPHLHFLWDRKDGGFIEYKRFDFSALNPMWLNLCSMNENGQRIVGSFQDYQFKQCPFFYDVGENKYLDINNLFIKQIGLLTLTDIGIISSDGLIIQGGTQSKEKPSLGDLINNRGGVPVAEVLRIRSENPEIAMFPEHGMFYAYIPSQDTIQAFAKEGIEISQFNPHLTKK